MKYCHYCGKPMADEAVLCVNCGRTVPSATTVNPGQSRNAAPVAPDDAPSFLYALLGFLVPLVGVILYFVEKESGAPLRARSCLRGAITGFVLSIVSSIFFTVLSILLTFM